MLPNALKTLRINTFNGKIAKQRHFYPRTSWDGTLSEVQRRGGIQVNRDPKSMLKNIFADIPTPLSAELVEALAEGTNFRLERIVSLGHITPPGEWYDQARDEWVILLSGRANLRFEGEASARVMRPGDYLMIPAHSRHRVDWTDPQEPSVWLALHYE